METRDVNNNLLSKETFENEAALIDAFAEKVADTEVNTIKVTKDMHTMTDIRRKYVEKKLRKLVVKAATLEKELSMAQ